MATSHVSNSATLSHVCLLPGTATASCEIQKDETLTEQVEEEREMASTHIIQTHQVPLIPLQTIPNVVRAEGFMVTDEDVLHAIEVMVQDGHFPNEVGGDPPQGERLFTAEQVRQVCAHFAASHRTESMPVIEHLDEINAPQQQHPVYRFLLLRRIHNFASKVARSLSDFWADRQRAGVYDAGIKPSNRLLITVVVVSLAMVLCVAGTAIGINWAFSMAREERILPNELQKIRHAMEHFALERARVQTEDSLHKTATMLAQLVSRVGFDADVNTILKTQANTVQTAGTIIDSIFFSTYKNRMAATAQLLATLVGMLCDQGFNHTVIPLINHLNWEVLDEGWEIVLGMNDTANHNAVKFLSNRRYVNKCPNSTCVPNSAAGLPIRSALQGTTGTVFGPDYAMQTVLAGFAFAPGPQYGIVYKCMLSVLQEQFQTEVARAIDRANEVFLGSTEMMLLTRDAQGGVKPLTQLRFGAFCQGPCYLDNLKPAFDGPMGWIYGPGYVNPMSFILGSYVFLPRVNATLVFKADIAELGAYLIQQIGNSVSATSRKLSGSKEVVMSHKIYLANGSTDVEIVSDLKFADECKAAKGKCGAAQAARLSALQCRDGGIRQKDYRGHDVTAGYACIPELEAGIVFKIDDEDLMDSCVEQTVEYANMRNEQVGNSLELQLAQAVNESGSVRNRHDVRCLTSLIHTTCSLDSNGHAPCLTDEATEPMISALNNQTGLMKADDYSDQAVEAAFTFSSGLRLGLVLKMDVAEIQQPLIISLLALLAMAVGVALLGVLILGVSARSMLAAMTDTWERGKLAVQQQKEAFEKLLSALYPKYVTEQLLRGDRQIVLELPEATVFFSDITNFTLTSNRISATELIQWVGYTFRVMDEAAEHFNIYKIKTIGDAFFAISGIPGYCGADDDAEATVVGGEGSQKTTKNRHARQMLDFASAVAQIFSNRFTHPGDEANEGDGNNGDEQKKKDAVEETPRGTPRMAKKEDKRQAKIGVVVPVESFPLPSGRAGPSARMPDSPKSSEKTTTNYGRSARRTANQSQLHCAMRYGIASGPVTTGVLHGKRPLFDVWGVTVNIANKMESTGRPGWIQCSDRTYRLVTEQNDNNNDRQPSSYVWEPPHPTYIKRVGTIQAYFVKGARQSPPKELLMKLHLEPRFGFFAFELPTQTTPTPAVTATKPLSASVFSSASASSSTTSIGGGGGGSSSSRELLNEIRVVKTEVRDDFHHKRVNSVVGGYGANVCEV